MKGSIISFDNINNSGQISGHDGKRYRFTMLDWQSNKKPTVGQEVDFVGNDEIAKDIVSLQGVESSSKSRLTFILLGIFLGGLGVHNFYAGYTGKGIAQLVISLVSLPLMIIIIGFFTLPAVGLWALLEAILIKVDSDGNLMN